MKIAVMVIALACSSWVYACCDKEVIPASCVDQSAVQYAQVFYRDHYFFYDDPAPEGVERLYTLEFGKSLTDHAECVGDEGFCNLEFDPWLNAQDGYMDGDIHYLVKESGENSAVVELRYPFRVHPSLAASEQKVSLLLKRKGASSCWKLDDMLLPDMSSMKALLLSDYQYFYYYKKSKLHWRLLSSGFRSSKVEVLRDGDLISEYELDCDVSEALNPAPEGLDGELNKIDLVVPPSHPQGLLITSCRVGAHSKQLSVYNLAEPDQNPIWQRTGSYFADWSLNANYELLLSYDLPCDGASCTSPFITETVLLRE